MAASVSLPLLNLRHNGPRGVGVQGAAPLKALRRFEDAPPDLLQQEKLKVTADRKNLFDSLCSRAPAYDPPFPFPPPTSPSWGKWAAMLVIGNDMDGTVGVLAKLNKMKEADKRIKVRVSSSTPRIWVPAAWWLQQPASTVDNPAGHSFPRGNLLFWRIFAGRCARH
jgi:hypothetical protein